MWSDNESIVDLLGFDHLVDAVCGIVENKNLLPATIGVFGDWGSGKSSLIQMAQEKLSKNDDVVVLRFNGWLFEGYEDAKTALMGTVLEELIDNKRFGPALKEKASRLLKTVNWWRTAFGIGKALVAVNSAGLTTPIIGASAAGDLGTTAKEAATALAQAGPEKVKDYLKEDEQTGLRKSIREFRADFSSLLKESKIKTLVVVIDDLDRCMPDTIIETLEAIKLFLFVPNTAFILGADERLVKYAVRKRFPELPGDQYEVGRDYLEKLVQFPIRIPPMGTSELNNYVGLLFSEAATLDSQKLKAVREYSLKARQGSFEKQIFNLSAAATLLGTIDAPFKESLILTERISHILAVGLNGNPRQCKRFLNTLMIRIKMAKARGLELQQGALAKLMLLEYLKPESFRTLAKWQAAQDGRPKELGIFEKRSTSGVSPEATKEKSEASSTTDSRVALEAWLSDSWLKIWVTTDPRLSEVDLRPYFYFSQDQLGPIVTEGSRMSPRAQEIMQKLFLGSDAIRNVGLNESKTLSTADSAAIFESIVKKTETTEDFGDEKGAFEILMRYVETRTDHLSQLITWISQRPAKDLPTAAASRLQSIGKASGSPTALYPLLQKWSKDTSNKPLAKEADRLLKASTR